MWTGQDWALLLGGVAVLLTGVGGFITSMVTLVRVGQVATSVDGLLKDRDAQNRAAGAVVGRKAGDDASAQRDEGAAQERERHRVAAALTQSQIGEPVPVADDRTAAAAERGATAMERSADAAEKKS